MNIWNVVAVTVVVGGIALIWWLIGGDKELPDGTKGR